MEEKFECHCGYITCNKYTIEKMKNLNICFACGKKLEEKND